jgi:hypothetical protein
MADDDGSVPLLAEELGVQLQSDQEQEEDHADLAQQVEVGNGGGGKDGCGPFGSDEPEETGAKHDAGDHLAHDLRLVQAREQDPHHPAQRQDECDLSEQDQDEVKAVHPPPGLACGGVIQPMRLFGRRDG